MDQDQLRQQLAVVLQDVLGKGDIVISPGITADQIEGWDSLSHVRIIIAVESHFNISIPTIQIPELRNVDEFVSLIEEKVKGVD